MTCTQSKSILSAYLDGALTGKQMHSLDQHLRQCSECYRAYDALRRTQSVLAKLGPARVPADLSLNLRLAISHEISRSRQSYFRAFLLHVENALHGFMVPATTGIVATVLIFGLVAGILAVPPSVHANAADVPLTFGTEPELQPNSFGFTMGPINGDSLLIEAYVDADGRVLNYRILSGAEDPKNVHELRSMLLMTTFRPATWMGTPRPSTAILSFSKISVKG
ncbi:MAG TPA: zf-HC2 domain-containing protein [Terriglobales bacterium]|nr:zf-HC2 domain-containing protein [Terriglobales bacterium]